MKLEALSNLLRALLVVGALALPAAAFQGPQQLAQLSSSDGRPGDTFGFEVSIDGDRVAIGAPRKRETPLSPVWGAVYVFVRSGTTWVEEAQLKNTDFGAPIDFGIDLELSGDRLAVASSGSAHVFVRQGTSGACERARCQPARSGLRVRERM